MGADRGRVLKGEAALTTIEGFQSTGDVRELRLGLVCYGGVSLAIYMHGITSELHKLVVASRALEEDSEKNPFDEASTEHHYWAALAKARDEAGGVTTRVVVDTISGTSAGGINGIFLAKALAHDLTQEELRGLWMERADKKQLAGGKIKIAAKVLGLLAGSLVPFVKAKPPLKGDAMLGWLLGALEGMRPRPRSGEGDRTSCLLPDDHELRLFVTTTDFFGYARRIPIADPKEIRETRHRHVMEFGHRQAGQTVSRDQLGTSHDTALAFAARATSSFPGAFPPVSLEDVNRRLRDIGRPEISLDPVVHELFREYELEAADPRRTHFVDGGVLDNAPFGHTIRAIFERPAGVEVDRRLLYIQPDPRFEPPNPKEAPPGWAKTIWGGLSTIAGYQPILDDLLEIRAFNERVRRIRQMIDRREEEVGTLLAGAFEGLEDFHLDQGLPSDVPRERLEGLRDLVHHRARDAAGFLYESYFQLKVHTVVGQFGRVIARLCEYPPESTQADLVARVAYCWAEEQGLIGPTADPDGQRSRQRTFLQTFDLGYTRRRVRFVIMAVNEMYGDLSADGDRPNRADLDQAKRALYHQGARLSGVIRGEALSEEIRSSVQDCFGADKLSQEALWEAGALDELALALCERHRDQLDDLEVRLGNEIQAVREGFRSDLYETFRELTASWSSDKRRRVVVRYLGFPFWDALIYPLQRLSDVGELDEVDVVRISPLDAVALAGADTSPDDLVTGKVKGVGTGHFAAFLKRWYRENDFLWGRLDGVERLLTVVLGRRPTAAEIKPALSAILDEERGLATEGKTRKQMKKIRKKIAAL